MLWHGAGWGKEWRAAHALLSAYGAFDFVGVAPADVDEHGQDMPLVLVAWAGALVNAELEPLVDLKKTLSKYSSGLLTLKNAQRSASMQALNGR